MIYPLVTGICRDLRQEQGARRIWTNRVGCVYFDEFDREARHDIEIAEAAIPSDRVTR